MLDAEELEDVWRKGHPLYIHREAQSLCLRSEVVLLHTNSQSLAYECLGIIGS